MLKCQSFDCVYNDKEENCFAKHISIDGRSAKKTSQTMCTSYLPENEFQNTEFAEDFMAIKKVPADVNNIVCAAQNCRFNQKQKCQAAHVKINSRSASCETFQQ